MIPRLLASLLFLLPAQSVRAQADRYELDPVHTRLVFFVQHAGFSRAIGTFSGITGTLMFDPDDWSTARVEAQVPLASLDLGDAKWRDKVLDPTFFQVKKYPVARFVSSRIEIGQNDRAKVWGELELHGVKREIVLDVGLNQLKRHPLTLKTTAGFSARTTLSRAAFSMRKWKKLVGDEVEVVIEVEATRVRRKSQQEGER